MSVAPSYRTGGEWGIINTGSLVQVEKVEACSFPERHGKHGPAALPGRPARPAPALGPSQRSGLRDRPPALDLRVSLPAAALRPL